MVNERTIYKSVVELRKIKKSDGEGLLDKQPLEAVTVPKPHGAGVLAYHVTRNQQELET